MNQNKIIKEKEKISQEIIHKNHQWATEIKALEKQIDELMKDCNHTDINRESALADSVYGKYCTVCGKLLTFNFTI